MSIPRTSAVAAAAVAVVFAAAPAQASPRTDAQRAARSAANRCTDDRFGSPPGAPGTGRSVVPLRLRGRKRWICAVVFNGGQGEGSLALKEEAARRRLPLRSATPDLLRTSSPLLAGGADPSPQDAGAAAGDERLDHRVVRPAPVRLVAVRSHQLLRRKRAPGCRSRIVLDRSPGRRPFQVRKRRLRTVKLWASPALEEQAGCTGATRRSWRRRSAAAAPAIDPAALAHVPARRRRAEGADRRRRCGVVLGPERPDPGDGVLRGTDRERRRRRRRPHGQRAGDRQPQQPSHAWAGSGRGGCAGRFMPLRIPGRIAVPGGVALSGRPREHRHPLVVALLRRDFAHRACELAVGRGRRQRHREQERRDRDRRRSPTA